MAKAEFRLKVKHGSGTFAVKASGSETLLEAIRSSDAEFHAPCGGNGTCAQCGVKVWGKVRSVEGTVFSCHGEKILACRHYPESDLMISAGEIAGAQIVAGSRCIDGGGDGLGLAVDIGTTTVAAYLYDLQSGECLATASAMNAQRGYGSDVISRIRCASEPEGLERLTHVIRHQIVMLAEELCGNISKISYFSIAGNTVMEHIFAEISPKSIGAAPFKPLSLFGTEQPARYYFPKAHENAILYLCPCVAGYVGGDITAGLLSSGAFESESTVLFIDIGTNGEIALGDRHGFVCCAAAAGPAFEGAEIECGSPAVTGAVSEVSRELEIKTIGGAEPRSICGSGLIDAVAALVCRGDIDETGRLEGEKFTLGGSVYLTGRDIRQVQLAKAAIRAGIESLLAASGRRYDEVSEVLIAGGFGAYMSVESACAIGLLPPALKKSTRHVGNSAGAGASMALTGAGRDALAKIKSECSNIELSSSDTFRDKYIDCMMFDEWEEL